jgi:hypothetical protein
MKAKSLRIAVRVMLPFAFQLMATAVDAQTVLIDEPFDFDIAGWNYFGGPEVIMRWDGAKGTPDPGSLQLSSKVELSDFSPLFEAMSECFPVSVGETFQLEAMVRANPRYRDSCFVSLIFFKGPNCSGQRNFYGNVPPSPPEVWKEDSLLVTVGTGNQSARVSLSLYLSPPAGLTTCNFDSVTLTRDPQ